MDTKESRVLGWKSTGTNAFPAAGELGIPHFSVQSSGIWGSAFPSPVSPRRDANGIYSLRAALAASPAQGPVSRHQLVPSCRFLVIFFLPPLHLLLPGLTVHCVTPQRAGATIFVNLGLLWLGIEITPVTVTRTLVNHPKSPCNASYSFNSTRKCFLLEMKVTSTKF